MADFDPNAYLAEGAAPAVQAPAQAPPIPQTPQAQPSGFDPEAYLNEGKFEGPGQSLKAGLEGVAQGVAGPLAPFAEHKLLSVPYEDIRGRAEAHPVAHGVGEVGGLGAGMLTGAGEGALMTKAGDAVAEAAGLGKAAADASYGYKVGSSAVKQAAEMAVLQGSDEASKMVVQDPDLSAQSAIANVGLAAALGGAGGAFVTGAVSPLWEATVGPKLESLLSTVKNHLNGGSKLVMGPAEEAAAKTLGVELDPVIRAGMSNDAKAGEVFSTLRRAEHPEVLSGIEKLHSDISNSVMDSMGITPESVQNYSENEGGRSVRDAFQSEVKEKYDPRALEMQQRDAEAAPMRTSDEDRLGHAGSLIEKGITSVGTDSPYFKDYQHYADRLMARDTVGEIDKLRSEIFGRMKQASRAGDDNSWKALSDIRNSIGDFQTNQIEKSAQLADKAALAQTRIAGMPRVNVGELPSAKPTADELIARRAQANKNYAQYANIMDATMDHLGLGEFKGTKGLLSKVTESLSPEQVFKKFTIKGNSDLIPFMQEHFPDTYKAIIENERKQLVKPAVLSAAKKGENPIDVKKLADIISKTQAGKPEYVKAVLPDLAVQRAQAGQTLANALPNPKDSGTPAGLAKILRQMPASALSALSWATGHGPVGGFMLGQAATYLGKDAPEAVKLSYLKYLASEQPVSANGFKHMFDYTNSALNGAKQLTKASAAVLKPGVQVLSDSQLPSHAEIMKLDRLVAKNNNDPQPLMNAQQGGAGHYMPDHQTALMQASLSQIQYLKGLKPQPLKIGPLDTEIKPSPAAIARYNRALMIAQQPAIVLQHVKDGTLQPTDIQDIKALAPAMYNSMAQQLSNQMTNRVSDEDPIPYKTRMGISLFLGQPLDNTMTPQSIMAAQPQPKPLPGQQQPQKSGKKGTSTLGKSNKSYETPNQAAESDRSGRD